MNLSGTKCNPSIFHGFIDKTGHHKALTWIGLYWLDSSSRYSHHFPRARRGYPQDPGFDDIRYSTPYSPGPDFPIHGPGGGGGIFG